MNLPLAARFWTAPVLLALFHGLGVSESGRGLPQMFSGLQMAFS
jgi:hypothetical protein